MQFFVLLCYLSLISANNQLKEDATHPSTRNIYSDVKQHTASYLKIPDILNLRTTGTEGTSFAPAESTYNFQIVAACHVKVFSELDLSFLHTTLSPQCIKLVTSNSNYFNKIKINQHYINEFKNIQCELVIVINDCNQETISRISALEMPHSVILNCPIYNLQTRLLFSNKFILDFYSENQPFIIDFPSTFLDSLSISTLRIASFKNTSIAFRNQDRLNMNTLDISETDDKLIDLSVISLILQYSNLKRLIVKNKYAYLASQEFILEAISNSELEYVNFATGMSKLSTRYRRNKNRLNCAVVVDETVSFFSWLPFLSSK